MFSNTVPMDQMQDYSQPILLRKLNLYFKKVGRPLIDEAGYCHGMAIEWLQKMAIGEECELYAVIKKIINCDDDKLEELNTDGAVQEYIKHIEFGQYPEKHLANENNQEQTIRFLDVDKIMGLSGQLIRKNYYSIPVFATLLDTHRNKSFIIINAHRHVHSIAIFIRNNDIYVYNANYIAGVAKCYQESADAAKEMARCLYQALGINAPQWMYLNIIELDLFAPKVNVDDSLSMICKKNNP